MSLLVVVRLSWVEAPAMEQRWLYQDGGRLLLKSCPRSTRNPLRCLRPCLISRVRTVVVMTHRAVKRLAVPLPSGRARGPRPQRRVVWGAPVREAAGAEFPALPDLPLPLPWLRFTPSTVHDDDVDDDAHRQCKFLWHGGYVSVNIWQTGRVHIQVRGSGELARRLSRLLRKPCPALSFRSFRFGLIRRGPLFF